MKPSQDRNIDMFSTSNTLESDDESITGFKNDFIIDCECYKFEKKVLSQPQIRPKNVPTLNLNVLWEQPYEETSEEDEGATTCRTTFSAYTTTHHDKLSNEI